MFDSYEQWQKPAPLKKHTCDLSRRDCDLYAFLAVSWDAADEEGHTTSKGDTVVPGAPDGGVTGHLAHAVLRHRVHLHNIVHTVLVTEHCTQTVELSIPTLVKWKASVKEKKRTYRVRRQPWRACSWAIRGRRSSSRRYRRQATALSLQPPCCYRFLVQAPLRIWVPWKSCCCCCYR